MKFKKLTIIFLFVYILVLSGCGSGNTPKGLWNSYVKAMNSKSVEKVAEVFYGEGTVKYKAFVEQNDETYFADLESIKTISFDEDIANEKYYSAYITIDLKDSAGLSSKDFYVYFYKDVVDRWRFTNEVDVLTYDITMLGNKPDNNFYNNIIKTSDGFEYKYIYGETSGVPSNKDYIKIVAPTSNQKVITIPETIEGVPVKVIGDYAFFSFNRIFSISIPNSNLQEITIPETVTTIQKYAFYQAKNLRSLTIPKSVKTVENYALASCSNLETLTINVDQSEMYGNLQSIPSRDSIEIVGDEIIYVGESVNYSVNASSVTWSSSDETIATVNEFGRVTAVAPGDVVITAVNQLNNNLYSKATIKVLPIEQKNITSTTSMSSFEFTIKSNWYVGDSTTLRIKSTSNQVTWSTSDSSKAIIDNSGKLTAVGTGQVQVTATSVANTSIKSVATINIKDISKKYAPVEFDTNHTPIVFTGAKKLYVDDYVKLNTQGYELGEIIWSSSDASIATVSMIDGDVIARGIGQVTITATLRDDPSIYSSVRINVAAADPLITFSENSLDRLYGLRELYFNAINPHSILIKGKIKFSPYTKIYVPAQNYNTYKIVWADYADQIYINPNL